MPGLQPTRPAAGRPGPGPGPGPELGPPGLRLGPSLELGPEAEGPGVEVHVFPHEGGDEIVGVVVEGLQPHLEQGCTCSPINQQTDNNQGPHALWLLTPKWKGKN